MPAAEVDAIDWSAEAVLHRRADLRGAKSEEALLDATATALDFPAWWGRNWDALLDCFGDLEWLGPAEGYVFSVAGARRLWAKAPDVAGLFTEIWLSAAEEWADDSKPWNPARRPFHLIWVL